MDSTPTNQPPQAPDQQPTQVSNAAPTQAPKKKGKGCIIALVIVLVVGIIGIILAGYIANNVFNEFKKNLPISIDNSKGNEQITIKTDKGTVSAGAGIPADFPKDIPIYTNAKAEGHALGLVTFSTQDKVDDIATFYEAKMKEQGWVTKTNTLGDMKMINATKGDLQTSITINPSKEKNQTDILIAIPKPKQQ